MDKLQELTDKLYQEGLIKGREEAASLVEQAKTEAQTIIDKAKAEAESIINKAVSQSQELKSKANSDINMAASQSIQGLKKDIENLIIAKISDTQVTKVMGSADFIKEIIRTVASKFSAECPADLSIILPEALQSQLEPVINNEIKDVLKTGIEASFSKRISGGFNIGPKDGGWYISLTDDTLRSLIAEYLRPTTKKILFGE